MRRRIPGTRPSWGSLREWVSLVHIVCGPVRSSTAEHERRARLCGSLTIEDIRSCTDGDALDAAASLFEASRTCDAGLYHGPYRSMSRAEIGERLVECRNQAHRLRSGAAHRQRRPGPRFDPQRMPISALERLIQGHPDLATVECLREERMRRLAETTFPSTENRPNEPHRSTPQKASRHDEPPARSI